MTISLCIITGNEAAHIERMLNSFADAFDELSLVRATGAATPDDSQGIAYKWCQDHQKKFTFSHYENAPANATFNHVDDFAAARNQSFAQASGDWLVWADCDDLIEDAAALRTAIDTAAPEVKMLRFPYDVPAAAKRTQRERAIRREIFQAGRQWAWPVHENLLLRAGDHWENRQSPAWQHQPVAAKSGGQQRNLRILTGALREAPTNYYYCHQENFHLGNAAQARRFGDLFLGLPGGNPAMRYQCHLNLCDLADLKDDATTHALKAHHLFPQQKEALAALVKCAFQEEAPHRALHWARELTTTPKLSIAERIWCYEPKWDGWAGHDLHARALRYAGKDEAADEVQRSVHGHTIPRISLLHATRGRPAQAVQCRDLWLDRAANPAQVEHIFAFDADDAPSHRWLRSFQHVISPESNCVAAWNRAAERSQGEILIQLSDDWSPPQDWDNLLIDATQAAHESDRHEYVIAVSDGQRKDELLCMAILSRARYEKQGHLFSPEYTGVFSDNEFTHRAYKDGVVLDARHLTFTHRHPAFGTAPMDATYQRQNAPEKYTQGEATFHRRNPEAKVIK